MLLPAHGERCDIIEPAGPVDGSQERVPPDVGVDDRPGRVGRPSLEYPVGGRLFDWIAAGKRVYTDTSWAIGFAPRWLVDQIRVRGVGADRVLFATDSPWGDVEGEHARLLAATGGDTELAEAFFRTNFEWFLGDQLDTARRGSDRPGRLTERDHRH